MTKRRTGGGAFDPSDRNLYFLAGGVSRVFDGIDSHQYVLTAVNEINGPEPERAVEAALDDGKKVLLDSGIYALAMDHAKANGLTHNEGLNMPPDQVEGFSALMDRYETLVHRWGDRLWGYIELDLGGQANKRRTRAMLEERGLAPIPVYHPLGDGWDYFDELAQGYDRICLGNTVRASWTARLRLLATINEHKRAYPDLWVHGLGISPSEMLNAYPIDSADSSSWMASLRWIPGFVERAASKSLGPVPDGFRYALGEADPPYDRSQAKSTRMCAYGAYMNFLNWRQTLDAVDGRSG